MSTDTMEAPATADTTDPELFTHEWDVSGICTNPEKVWVGETKGWQVTLLLGLSTEGEWRGGYITIRGGVARQRVGPELSQRGWASRAACMRSVLSDLCRIHSNQKALVKFLESWYANCDQGKKVDQPAPAPTAEPSPHALPHGRFEVALPMAQISPNPFQPRRHFAEGPLAELAASMAVGQLQPIAVRRLSAEELGELAEVDAAAPVDRYEIILGERRYRAKQLLKHETIEAKVYEGLTRQQAKAAALIENLQREQLNAIEEAEGYRDLMETENLTQEQCAERVGRKRPTVANALRVLSLPPAVVTRIQIGELTMAHGTALARFRPKNEKIAEQLPNWEAVVTTMATVAVEEGLSAGAMEQGVPAERELITEGLGCYCRTWDTGGETPEEIKKHPAYHQVSGDWYCLEPAHWKGLVKEYKATRLAEQEADRARRDKATAAAAANPTKIKDLADLPWDAYRILGDQDKETLALLPSQSVVDAPDSRRSEDPEKPMMITVTTAPELYRKLEKALLDLKAADRVEKLPAAVAAAQEAIPKIKKLGTRELIMLNVLAANPEDVTGGFSIAGAKALGVKLPKRGYDSYDDDLMVPVFTAVAFTAIEKASTPVELFQLLLWTRLEMETTDYRGGLSYEDKHSDSTACVLLRWILKADTLDLLEETRAGTKQLLNTIKEAEWYQQAIAEIEGGESK